MIFFLACVLITVCIISIPLIAFYRDHGMRHTSFYCALHGHEPKCSIENCGVIRWTCQHCKQEVGPL